MSEPDPEEPYRPRPTDHLVEPMFEALGTGADGADGGEPEPEPARGGCLGAILLLALWLAP